MNDQEANQVEMIPRTSTENCQERNQDERQLVESLFRETMERQERQLYREWNFYRGDVGRLLSEGHEGRFILIKGEEVIGIWDTQAEAETIARQRYLLQPCLIHQIRSQEPLVRRSTRLWRWPS